MAAAPPDKNTLVAFTPKAKDEIERNKFVAVSGGLVNLSAPTYWELFHAAQAWHEHAAAMKQTNDATAAYLDQGAALGQVVDDMVRAGALIDGPNNDKAP